MKASLIFLSLVIVVSCAVCRRIQRRAGDALRETDARFCEQAESLARLKDEASGLSNFIAHLTGEPSLTDVQFRQLLRLRSEVGGLLAQRGQITQLQAANQELRARLAQSQAPNPDHTRWARDQLFDAGHADPESAIITTLWAFNSDDPNVQIAMTTPEDIAFLDALVNQGKPVDVSQYLKNIGELLNPSTATGICLVGKISVSPDEVFLDLYYEGEGRTRRFLMKQVGGVWQLADLISITAH